MGQMQRVASAVLLVLLAALLPALSSSGAAGPVRMQLSHSDAGRGFIPGELLKRMALGSKARAARFLSGSPSPAPASAPVTPGPHNGASNWTEYLVQLGIGTPRQDVKLVLDTGSDLIWTQCQPCAAAAASCFPQDLPLLDPSQSSTFQELPCDSTACKDDLPSSSCGTGSSGSQQTCLYNYSYGDKSTTSGQLVADTFVLGQGQTATAVPSLTFGCGYNNILTFKPNNETTGIAGFGRGALSLPSQLKVDNFSYCFTNSTGSTPSPVLLGLPANLYGSGGAAAAVQTTPLIQTSVPSHYYLNLTSITVGSTTLQVPASAFALNGNGTGGTIIDSGTSITLLPPTVYSLFRNAFVSEMNQTPVPDDYFLCFAVSSSSTTTVPQLQLQFDQDATLDLPLDNYVFYVPEEDGQTNMCVAILSSSSATNMTIIGNYQQQNMHVLYDLAGNMLSFVPAQCDMI